MNIINQLKAAFLRSAEKSGRARAQRELLSMSERQLKDFGFSRALLLQGDKAWPWREAAVSPVAKVALADSEAVSTTPVDEANVGTAAVGVVETDKRALKQDKQAVKRAIKELNAFTDRELAELGVARNSIEEVVRFGRPSVEGVFDNNRSAA